MTPSVYKKAANHIYDLPLINIKYVYSTNAPLNWLLYMS